MKNNLIEQLFQLMVEGLYLSEINGVCKIQIDDDVIFVSHHNSKLICAKTLQEKPNATVKMGSQILSEILGNLHKFDLRDPNVLMQVSIEGSIELAGLLFNFLKRPSPQVNQLIKETEEKCQGYQDNILEVKRIHKPSEEEVIFMMDKSVPFVITGMIDNWEFISSNLTELKDKYGDVRLRPIAEKGKEKFQTMRDFIEQVENVTDNSLYTGGCQVPPAMWSKFKMPYFDSTSFTAPQIWMGSKSGDKPCTALHRDCYHGMLANISGRKKMILFSPEQTASLYTHNAFNTFQTSDIKDVQDVDLDRFPLFANTHSIEVTVGPGEVLVIPAFWYHCVYAVDNVFSISACVLWEAWEQLKPADQTVNLTL